MRRGSLGPSQRWPRLAGCLALGATAAFLSGCGYGQIQELEQQLATARSEMEVQLQRRSEIVPTLLETVGAYGVIEEGLIAAVADARAQLVAEVKSEDLVRMQKADALMQRALEGLLEVTRRDESIESDASYRVLSSQLEMARQKFREARLGYNEAVRRYNIFIGEFPQLVTAKVIGATRLELLEAEAADPPPNSVATDGGPD